LLENNLAIKSIRPFAIPAAACSHWRTVPETATNRLTEPGMWRSLPGSVLPVDFGGNMIPHKTIHENSSDLLPLLRASDVDALRSRHLGLPVWWSEVLDEYRTIIGSKEFPCFFAPIALKKDLLLFGFADSASREHDLRRIRYTILAYLDRVRGRTDLEADMTVLNIFIKPGDAPATSGEYHEQTETILRYLHMTDPSYWPEAVPTDQDNTKWSFCLDDVPMFVNVSHPAHEKRASRNVGSALTLVVQPREVFDRIANAKNRSEIRRRLEQFDSVPPSGWLDSYGSSQAREGMQYDLSDDSDGPFTTWDIRPPR
jgi:uncharacterized protein